MAHIMSSNDLTNSQYWLEIQSISNEIISEALQQSDNDPTQAKELIADELLHQTIDNHEYIIYTPNNLRVIQISPNDEYAIEEFGTEWAGELLSKQGLSALHAGIAFYAMYQDAAEKISELWELTNG